MHWRQDRSRGVGTANWLNLQIHLVLRTCTETSSLPAEDSAIVLARLSDSWNHGACKNLSSRIVLLLHHFDNQKSFFRTGWGAAHMVSSKPSTSRIKYGCQVIPRGPNGWHLEGRIESPQFHYPHLCLYRHQRREGWNGKESPEISLGGRRGRYEPHASRFVVCTSLTRTEHLSDEKRQKAEC